MGIQVLLVASPGIARDAYLEALGALGASTVLADGPVGVLNAVSSNDFQGILFDTPTLIRDKSFDRRTLSKLESIYPVMRLRFDHRAGRIDGIAGQHIFTQGEALDCFIKVQCAQFMPRTLRGAKRVDVCLPVLLCPVRGADIQGGPDLTPCPPCSCEKTATLNISMSGCFVFSVIPRTLGDKLRLVFFDFKDRTPVDATVAWVRTWGEDREAPGLGLEFARVTKAQEEELTSLGLSPTAAPLAPEAQAV